MNKMMIGGLAAMVVATAVGCRNDVKKRWRATIAQGATTIDYVSGVDAKPFNNNAPMSVDVPQQEPQYVEFSFRGNPILYQCGTPQDTYQQRAEIKQKVHDLYMDLAIKEQGRATPYDMLVFTKDVLDRNNDRIITAAEIAMVDREALRPNAQWTQRYQKGTGAHAGRYRR